MIKFTIPCEMQMEIYLCRAQSFCGRHAHAPVAELDADFNPDSIVSFLRSQKFWTGFTVLQQFVNMCVYMYVLLFEDRFVISGFRFYFLNEIYCI